jgi:Reverse transcriptase (RNA-dependent DNA polymerase)
MKTAEDYCDTHTFVVKSTTIRILLSLAASLGMIVELDDVETTYLNTALWEFVHVEQPPYFELKDRAKYVLLLNQALYGLCTIWIRTTLCATLEAIGFHSIADDNNLYPTIPMIAKAQQQSSSLCMSMILSLPLRINRQLTQQSTTSTRPSTFTV